MIVLPVIICGGKWDYRHLEHAESEHVAGLSKDKSTKVVIYEPSEVDSGYYLRWAASVSAAAEMFWERGVAVIKLDRSVQN